MWVESKGKWTLIAHWSVCFLFIDIALALIAFACAPALGQSVDCTEEFFRTGRGETCQNFFVCMIGGRIDFTCDEGQIFDEQRVTCRNGNLETCEFEPLEIPSNACDNEFLMISSHPDPYLCAQFFVCMNFNIIHFRCDAGYIFNMNAKRCIPGNQETCRESGSTPYDGLMHALKL